MAMERCNQIDDECDEPIDEDGGATWYQDADGDGHGDPSATDSSCEMPAGYSSEADDCLDSDPAVYPWAEEVCDGLPPGDRGLGPGVSGRSLISAADDAGGDRPTGAPATPRRGPRARWRGTCSLPR